MHLAHAPGEPIRAAPISRRIAALHGVRSGHQQRTPSQPPPLRPAPTTPDLDHTADVQLHAWGATLEDAFASVALAMYNYMTPIDGLEVDASLDRCCQLGTSAPLDPLPPARAHGNPPLRAHTPKHTPALSAPLPPPPPPHAGRLRRRATTCRAYCTTSWTSCCLCSGEAGGAQPQESRGAGGGRQADQGPVRAMLLPRPADPAAHQGGWDAARSLLPRVTRLLNERVDVARARAALSSWCARSCGSPAWTVRASSCLRQGGCEA